MYHHHDDRSTPNRLRKRLTRRERRNRPGAQRTVDLRNAWRNRALMQLRHWPDGTVLGWRLAIHRTEDRGSRRPRPGDMLTCDTTPVAERIAWALGIGVALWAAAMVLVPGA